MEGNNLLRGDFTEVTNLAWNKAQLKCGKNEWLNTCEAAALDSLQGSNCWQLCCRPPVFLERELDRTR